MSLDQKDLLTEFRVTNELTGAVFKFVGFGLGAVFVALPVLATVWWRLYDHVQTGKWFA